MTNLEKIKKIFHDLFESIRESNLETNTQNLIVYILYFICILAPILMIIGLITLIINHPFTALMLILSPFIYMVYQAFKKRRDEDDFFSTRNKGE